MVARYHNIEANFAYVEVANDHDDKVTHRSILEKTILGPREGKSWTILEKKKISFLA
jgi:hypothetical protein